MPNAHAPDLSVILVTYNSACHLGDSLVAIPAAVGEYGYEVVVVDNCSTDGTQSIAVSTCAHCHLVENSHNDGFAAAANQGASVATGNWLYFLNPDLILDPLALTELIKFAHDNDPRSTFATRLRNSDGSFQPSCRRLPTVRNLFASRGSFIGRIINSPDLYTIGDSSFPREVPAVAGAGLLIQREFFVSLGGFDTRFFLYMEDTDLSARVLDKGGKNWFVPQSGGVHYWQEGSSASALRREWFHHVSLARYFQKHQPGLISTLLIPIALGIHYLIVAAQALLFGTRRTR